MTRLRQQMSDAMLVRGFAVRTQESYLYAVTALANYYHRPPDTLSLNELQNYFLYLVKERGLSSATSPKAPTVGAACTSTPSVSFIFTY